MKYEGNCAITDKIQGYIFQEYFQFLPIKGGLRKQPPVISFRSQGRKRDSSGGPE